MSNEELEKGPLDSISKSIRVLCYRSPTLVSYPPSMLGMQFLLAVCKHVGALPIYIGDVLLGVVSRMCPDSGHENVDDE